MSDTLTKRVKETSNIFVFKGYDDTVWVFNAGYGDPNGDVAEYRSGWDCTRSGFSDAYDVDSVITIQFGMNRSKVKFMFIAPHYHLDHINVEFLSPFFTQFGYDSTTAKIFIHIKDYFSAVCTYDSSCGSIWGGPEKEPWSEAPFLLNMFKTIGEENDPCNTLVLTFSTEVGICEVRKDFDESIGGHTDGTINLLFPSQKIFIRGGFSPQTPTPCFDLSGWQTAQVHHSVNLSFNITGIENGDNIADMPSQYELKQNYPNPFNPSTTISYKLQAASYVTLKVYDLFGKELITLVDEYKQAGIYHFTFNTLHSALASGVYFYQLKAGSFTETKKLMLLK